MKINKHYAGHMTKMAAMTIYGIIPGSKSFFPGNIGSILMKHGMKQ